MFEFKGRKFNRKKEGKRKSSNSTENRGCSSPHLGSNLIIGYPWAPKFLLMEGLDGMGELVATDICNTYQRHTALQYYLIIMCLFYGVIWWTFNSLLLITYYPVQLVMLETKKKLARWYPEMMPPSKHTHSNGIGIVVWQFGRIDSLQSAGYIMNPFNQTVWKA